MDTKKQHKRLVKAFLIVLVIIACVPIVQIFLDTGLSIDMTKNKEKASSSFCSDVCSLEGLDIQDYMEECDSNVIGFTVSNNNADEVFKNLAERLNSNSWQKINSENPRNATFVTSSKEKSWLFLNCTPFSNSTSVVITLS